MLRELREPANLLSLVRIPLGVAAVVSHQSATALLVLAALAGISDVLDGAVARATHPEHAREAEPMGAWLDPVCDKAFVLGWVIAVWLRGAPLWVLALVGVRDVGIAITGTAQLLIPTLRDRVRRYTALWSGKVTTVLQFGALVAVLLDAPPVLVDTLATLAALLGLVAVGQYVARALAQRPADPPVDGS